MALYSKLGSIPKPETDGTKGWVQVPDAPAVPESKELAWLNGEWVVRDPKPTDRPGYQWNWNHAARDWVECGFGATVAISPQIPQTSYSVTLAAPSLVSSPVITIGKE
jgi:hypothetical protein